MFVINSQTTLFTDNSVPAGLAYTQGFMYMVATNGTFSVDTFFVVGGLLTAYLLIKRWNKNGKADNVLLLYLHRYIRYKKYIFSMNFYSFHLM